MNCSDIDDDTEPFEGTPYGRYPVEKRYPRTEMSIDSLFQALGTDSVTVERNAIKGVTSILHQLNRIARSSTPIMIVSYMHIKEMDGSAIHKVFHYVLH
jgi:hypothetical protein